MRSLQILLSLVLAAVWTLPAQTRSPSQTRLDDPYSRPRIGLALSGGSALGFAHVGVIKWLEENHIPIDYVAGSSMGALVAGTYAAGFKSAEIDQFLTDIDWNQVLAPTVPYSDLSYRRKEDQRDYPTTLEMGYKKGIKLPSALSAGQGVSLIIGRIAAPYSELASFDELPTPFRCVATDLVKGREVIFEKGSLQAALRASMSIPGLFAPIRDGEMILVDGGLLNNLPVDVVKKMGADIVIAVALDKPPEEGKFTSLLGIAGRSISVMVSANERRSLGLADLVVMPDLNGLGSGDFLKWPEFEQRGYDAANAKAAMLRRISLPPDEYEEYQRARQARRLPHTVKPQIAEVDASVAPKYQDALLHAVAGHPDEPLNLAVLEEQLNKLTGTGRFDRATYEFIHKDGKEGVRIKTHEKDYGPPFLKLGILLDASRQEGFRFGIGGRLTFLDVGGPASEWRTDLSIGQINRLSTEYYYRFRGGKWFAAPRLYYNEDSKPFYEGDQQVSDFITREAGGAFDLGYAFGRFKEVRVGYTLSHNRIAVSKGQSTFEPLVGRYSDVHVRWAHEGQNSALVPRNGVRAVVQSSLVFDQPGVDGKFGTAQAVISHARPFSPNWSILSSVEGGVAPNDDALNTLYALGGVGRIDALGRGRLLGNRYYYGGFRVLRTMASDSLSIFGRFYLTSGVEVGNAWSGTGSFLPRYSGSAGLIGETAVGIVYFGGGIGDRGDGRLFFRLGRVF